MAGSQMDAKGIDVADAAGRPEDNNVPSRPRIHQSQGGDNYEVIQLEDPISDKEFTASEYKVCPNVGKAVIVSNFMEGYEPRKDYFANRKDFEKRDYAENDCRNLENALAALGFEPLTGEKSMVHKNLTKSQLEQLYNKAAKAENYRKKGQEYTCVLFIVMSYGRSGLIRCHPKDGNSPLDYVEQKNMLEAFQPQNNNSLALKPKIFIVQTIPEERTVADDHGEKITVTTRRIPREADFLTYSSDSYCIDKRADSENPNNFVRSIVTVLKDLVADKKKNRPAMEIQRLLIRMNSEFKKKNQNKEKIPCVTSSLTKQLKLF